ncbi:MAG: prolyl oligopeptidase family serine peptidase [Verrucomicrobiae bacterium]|nr:prolyl oligopeptidase family serine peptidase [Verrucomicrobiae bacterium]MCP5550181.1 prolyl oligopeptidase family serine peptidase [Akkermansiaceae bacterium]
MPLAPAPARAQDSAARDPQTGQQYRETVTRELSLKYLLQLPESYDAPENADKKWPLLVFLHGAGERGDNLELLKKHGPPKLIAAGRRFPAIVVSPQCPENGWWPEEPVMEFLDSLEKTYRVDTDRVYLTGLSMGGYGTWAFASRAPERFAAAVPICGGGVPYFMRKLKDLPLWIFHGGKDTAVPIEESGRLVEALKKAGNATVQFTVYPEAGHDSWTAAYDTEALWDWLFAQSLAKR